VEAKENVTIAVNAAPFTFYRDCGCSVRRQLATIGQRYRRMRS
jgi:hypothetical protein